jgi:hypothetical protein
MKGGLASMTMAVQILRDLGVRLAGDVILQYVVDEELTGYGTLAAVIKGYRADAGICLETSDLCVQPACVGRLWFTLEAGRASDRSDRDRRLPERGGTHTRGERAGWRRRHALPHQVCQNANGHFRPWPQLGDARGR